MKSQAEMEDLSRLNPYIIYIFIIALNMGESGHRFVQYLKRRFPDGNPQLEKQLKKN